MYIYVSGLNRCEYVYTHTNIITFPLPPFPPFPPPLPPPFPPLPPPLPVVPIFSQYACGHWKVGLKVLCTPKVKRR